MSATVERPVWAALAGPEHAPGLEQIYEGYLLHYGAVTARAGADGELLQGDEQYAQGLARVAELDDPEAIAALAELIGLASRERAENGEQTDDFALWAATARFLADRSERDAYHAALVSLRDARDTGPLERLVAPLPVERERDAHRRLAGSGR
ncbi:MAG TPA: hypothetical protein VGK92_06510 [Gaiellales bacterium]